MKKKQTILLLELAERITKEKTKDIALNSLKSAGLLNSSGKVTKNYPNLNRVLSASIR
jgi:hypothetical protein